MRVLGIMSGTSLDGVDYALCEIASAAKIRLLEHWSVAFPKSLKERLHRAARNEATSYEVGELHHALGRFYAKGMEARRGKRRVELIGLHGQTVFHNPGRATLQLGEPAYLAEQLRVPIISNFRATDIAAGGQGAPLATIFHRHVFARRGEHIAVNNLGGISNVTSLDWRRGKEPRVIAFDTGPGNVLIDMAAREFFNKPFDRNGTFARRGNISERHVGDWLKHPYFRLAPPKSTGRELFGEPFFKEALKLKLAPHDLVATFTELTARSIAFCYRADLPSLPRAVILAGGGSQNKFLVERISAAFQELDSTIQVQTTADYGWDPQVIEAAAFALLAWLTWRKQPGNIPATTGAKGPRILGQITQTLSS
jgi:anhydro-N-acetylmuramic acid kinase